ncbi:MAG: condensation domain-containing protein, partial [Jatrophihabitantaceae bacterium]
MIPLSNAQRRLWFIQQFEGPSATYNVPLLVRLTGQLDRPALTAAIRDVIERHEVLRTVITNTAGVPAQVVIACAELVFDVPVIDVTPETVAAARSEASGYCFDLSSEIPLRATLLRLGEQQHELVLNVHHIAIDGESLAPLAHDLEQAYTARVAGAAPAGPTLPDLTVQYRDYAEWQREVLGDPADADSVLATQLRFWCDELSGAPDQLAIAVDHPRPPVPSGRGGMVEFPIPTELVEAATRLAGEHAATPSMVLQAALAVLLFELGAGEDVPIGSTYAGRGDEALTELVGFFVNTWV